MAKKNPLLDCFLSHTCVAYQRARIWSIWTLIERTLLLCLRAHARFVNINIDFTRSSLQPRTQHIHSNRAPCAAFLKRTQNEHARFTRAPSGVVSGRAALETEFTSHAAAVFSALLASCRVNERNARVCVCAHPRAPNKLNVFIFAVLIARMPDRIMGSTHGGDRALPQPWMRERLFVRQ